MLFKKITYWIFFSKLIAILFENSIFITKFILTITFVRQALLTLHMQEIEPEIINDLHKAQQLHQNPRHLSFLSPLHKYKS